MYCVGISLPLFDIIWDGVPVYNARSHFTIICVVKLDGSFFEAGKCTKGIF